MEKKALTSNDNGKMEKIKEIKKMKPNKQVKDYQLFEENIEESYNTKIKIAIKAGDNERSKLFIAKIYINVKIICNPSDILKNLQEILKKVENSSKKIPHVLLPVNYAYSERSKSLYILSKIRNNFSIEDYLQSERGPMSTAEIQKVLIQITFALKELQKLSIYHTGISSDHIYVKKKKSGSMDYFLGAIEYCVTNNKGNNDKVLSQNPYSAYNLHYGDMFIPFSKRYSYSLAVLALSLSKGYQVFPCEFHEIHKEIIEVSLNCPYYTQLLVDCILKPIEYKWDFDMFCNMCKHITETNCPKSITWPENLELIKSSKYHANYKTTYYGGVLRKQGHKFKVIIKKTKLPKLGEDFYGEQKIAEKLKDSPYALKIINYFEYKEKYYFIYENCEGKMFKDFLKWKKDKILFEDLQILMLYILNALYEIRSNKFYIVKEIDINNLFICLSKSDEITGIKFMDFSSFNSEDFDWCFRCNLSPEETLLFKMLSFHLLDHDLLGEMGKVIEQGVYYHITYTSFKAKAQGTQSQSLNKIPTCEDELIDEFISFIRTNPYKNRIDTLINATCIQDLILKAKTKDLEYKLNSSNIIKNADIYKTYKLDSANGMIMISDISKELELELDLIKQTILHLTILKSCKYVLNFKEYYRTNDNKIYMILDYYDSKYLLSEIINIIHEKNIIPLIKEILKSIIEINKYHIILRNLRPDKILVITPNENNPDISINIVDCTYSIFEYRDLKKYIKPPGNDFYTAPEVKESKEEISSTDIWSFGMILMFINYGIHPSDFGIKYEDFSSIPFRKLIEQSPYKDKAKIKDLDFIIENCINGNIQTRKTSSKVIELIEKN